ncbi:hypothetical protein DPEC_G00037340 [Dallia pectoralis]|uniref:Uncharacterized protein n=1 Tax=Dallia pectoralis TaxID=75939 RepID=A0ACC2HDR9_DALPE|nr:hypothetical protein DPEC_G00037340 [Dallia pectoralis]
MSPNSWRPYLHGGENDGFINVKLSAIRQSFELILSNPDIKHYIKETGQSLVGGLLALAGKMQTVGFYDIFYESIVLKVLAYHEDIPAILKPTLRTPWISERSKKTTVMFYAWSQIKNNRDCLIVGKT